MLYPEVAWLLVDSITEQKLQEIYVDLLNNILYRLSTTLSDVPSRQMKYMKCTYKDCQNSNTESE
jgi:hypothetical protein